ncbi:endonuclease domain-containing protein [Caulobacter sp. LARHSG274]
MSVERARALRKTMSTQEVRLWVRLRALRAEGFHFRRQRPILGYYPDFVCLSRGLVVEVDGPHHQELEQAAHDARRDQVFSRSGFQTLRFATRAVHEDIDAVMDVICHALSAASPTRPLRGHPPHKGEGRDLS